MAADLQARQLDAQVALMRALGGGWQGEALAAAALATVTTEPRR